MHKIHEFFAWGNAFLQRSQLRSLRNLTLLPEPTAVEILNQITKIDVEFDLLIDWYTFCKDDSKSIRRALAQWCTEIKQAKEYLNANTTERSDPFAGCYFSDGTISGKGLQLRMEAGICKDAK
jgi:hypothetical protein